MRVVQRIFQEVEVGIREVTPGYQVIWFELFDIRCKLRDCGFSRLQGIGPGSLGRRFSPCEANIQLSSPSIPSELLLVGVRWGNPMSSAFFGLPGVMGQGRLGWFRIARHVCCAWSAGSRAAVAIPTAAPGTRCLRKAVMKPARRLHRLFFWRGRCDSRAACESQSEHLGARSKTADVCVDVPCDTWPWLLVYVQSRLIILNHSLR